MTQQPPTTPPRMGQSERFAWILTAIEFAIITALFIAFTHYQESAKDWERRAVMAEAKCLLSSATGRVCTP